MQREVFGLFYGLVVSVESTSRSALFFYLNSWTESFKRDGLGFIYQISSRIEYMVVRQQGSLLVV